MIDLHKHLCELELGELAEVVDTHSTSVTTANDLYLKRVAGLETSVSKIQNMLCGDQYHRGKVREFDGRRWIS